MNNLQQNFSRIYDEYVDKIYRFIFLKVNSREISEDLTSETFIRFWNNLKQNNKIENIPAFLYKIARNLVTDHYRQKGKIQITSIDNLSVVDNEINLEEKVCNDSDFETVKSALANLRENYQELIIWRYLDDLSISEIAQITNKSEAAIRTTLSRAVKALKTYFKEV